MRHKLPICRIFKKFLSLSWERDGFAFQLGWPAILLSTAYGGLTHEFPKEDISMRA